MRSRIDQPRVGFTMIEVITVLTLVGIMLAISAPRFRISEAMEVQVAARQLAQDIDFARTRALAARVPVRVTFDQAAVSYTGYLDDDANGAIGQTLAERQAMRGFGMRALSPRLEFARGGVPEVSGVSSGGGPITFPSARVDFDSRGIVAPVGASGAIYIRHRSKPLHVAAVTVTSAGNVRLWTWRDGAWR